MNESLHDTLQSLSSVSYRQGYLEALKELEEIGTYQGKYLINGKWEDALVIPSWELKDKINQLKKET